MLALTDGCDGPSFDRNHSGGGVVQAEDAAQQFGSSGSHESSHPEDLAATQRDTDVAGVGDALHDP